MHLPMWLTLPPFPAQRSSPWTASEGRRIITQYPVSDGMSTVGGKISHPFLVRYIHNSGGKLGRKTPEANCPPNGPTQPQILSSSLSHMNQAYYFNSIKCERGMRAASE